MVFSGQTTEILKFRSLYRAYRTGAQVVRLEWSRTALASSRLSLLEMQARVLPGRKPVTRKRIHIDLSGSKRHQILYILGPRCAKRHQKSDLKPGRINLLRLRQLIFVRTSPESSPKGENPWLRADSLLKLA